MSYEEKGTWLFLAVIVATYTAYVVTILGRADGIPLEDVDYEGTLIWSIGLVIGLSILGRIALAILSEVAGRVRIAAGDDQPRADHTMDARDKEILRFGEYVGGVVLGVVMVVPLGLALAEAEHFWIANAMYAAFVVSALVSTPMKLIAYRRGF